MILYDLADHENTLKVNTWNWRPAREMMQYNVTVTVTLGEARAIADHLERRFLSKMNADDRVRLDLTLTDAPDDFQLHHDDLKNYGVTQEGL